MTPPSPASQDIITHIAELARIKLSEEEIVGFVKKQQAVLEYIAQLQRVATHTLSHERRININPNPVRPDVITHMPSTSSLRILDSSPLREGTAVKIVNVFK